MELRATGALSGEVLFDGVVRSYAHLLHKLAPLPGSRGFRLLLGSSEVLCDRELTETYDGAQERPAAISILCDNVLQERLRYVEQRYPLLADWWNDRAFTYHACRLRPSLVPQACNARGRGDQAFLLYAIATNEYAMLFAGHREASFYVDAVACNPLAYGQVPLHIRHCCDSMLKRQLAFSALRDSRMWHLLPNSYDDIAAYLDELETRPTPQRAAAEVWHTRESPSLLQHAQQNMRVRSCRSLMTKAVTRCWRELKFATWDLRCDQAVVSAAVARHWRALQYASYELRGDRELLRVALQQNGLALCFASYTLRADEDLARLAVRAQRRALQYVIPALIAKWSSPATVMLASSREDAATQDASSSH